MDLQGVLCPKSHGLTLIRIGCRDAGSVQYTSKIDDVRTYFVKRHLTLNEILSA